MKKSTTFLSLFLILALPCLGFFVGQSIWNRDYSPSWKQFYSPYRFIKIEYADSSTVWARTTDNKLYFQKTNTYCGNDKCDQWAVTETVGEKAFPNEIIRKDTTCPKFVNSQPTKPSRKVIECTLGVFQGIVASGNYYALLEDGTIWLQSLPQTCEGPCLSILIFPCSGFLVGLMVAGLIIFIIRDLSSDSKWFWRS